MKTLWIIMLLSLIGTTTAFTQTAKQKGAEDSTKKSHQTLYFRGFGPCDLSKELNKTEKELLSSFLVNDTSVAQIRFDFEHPSKEFAPIVNKLSEESKACILKTAKFSEGPTGSSKTPGTK